MTMKAKIVWILGMVVGIAACNQEEQADFSGGKSLPVEVVSASVGSEAVTRAFTDITATTYQLGIIRPVIEGYAYQSTSYFYSDLALGWISPHPVLVNEYNAKLYGYYPYHEASGNYAGLATGSTFIVQAQPYAEPEDMCYGIGRSRVNDYDYASLIDYRMNFPMKRAYSRLKLTLVRSDFYATSKACRVTKITLKTVTGSNFYTQRTLDITTGVYSGGILSDEYVCTVDASLETGIETDFDFLLPPQTLSGGLNVTLVIDGISRPVTISSISELVAGTYYGVKLTIQDVEVVPQATVISVNDYGGQSNVNGGNYDL
ncbi:fimbrillin family protein [Bacteroides nordii]|uniref:Fimbrillin family protein n=2 Tax=Bacteroides nordii TaxID=291645 RepID=A0A413VIF4_9BACE|nr:fimbrillin family protein [Bacteroides nordii]